MSTATIRTVVIPAATVTVVSSASDGRPGKKIINIGVNPATLGSTDAVTAGNGWPLAAADEAGGQGGGIDLDRAPGGAIYAISTLGTTLCVMEG